MTKVNHILLVDDDEATNVLNQLIISEAQLADKVSVRETGKLAIEYLLELDSNNEPLPEIIFLDINMPVMNGWEFLEAYRKYNLHQNKTSIVVMLTTSLNPDDQKRAETIDIIEGYRHKPITRNLLTEMITKHLSKASKQVY